tara:strand:+ start:1757 stop:1915 length:159 start_codon:yes stop_codon:yes gene_type:complete
MATGFLEGIDIILTEPGLSQVYQSIIIFSDRRAHTIAAHFQNRAIRISRFNV